MPRAINPPVFRKGFVKATRAQQQREDSYP